VIGEPMDRGADRADGYFAAALLLFNTTRAHTPDPQARGPLSLWTEVILERSTRRELRKS